MTQVKIRVASATFAAGTRCDDHVGIVRRDDGVVLLLADGAGNNSDGGSAAEWFVAQLSERSKSAKHIPSADLLAQWAHELDAQWFGTGSRGESTLVMASLADGKVQGASVGDSGAWLVHSGFHQIHACHASHIHLEICRSKPHVVAYLIKPLNQVS